VSDLNEAATKLAEKHGRLEYLRAKAAFYISALAEVEHESLTLEREIRAHNEAYTMASLLNVKMLHDGEDRYTEHDPHESLGVGVCPPREMHA
jgi:hypothetical protein